MFRSVVEYFLRLREIWQNHTKQELVLILSNICQLSETALYSGLNGYRHIVGNCGGFW